MIRRFQTFGLLLVYLLVVSVHVFFLPKITSGTLTTHHQTFKRKIENVQSFNKLERTDKAIIKNSVNCEAFSSLRTVFTKPGISNQKVIAIRLRNQVLQNKRHAYLSYCMFRI